MYDDKTVYHDKVVTTQASLYTREIPYYTDASFSAFAWKTNLTNHTKSLNDTMRTFIHRHVRTV